MRIYLIRHADPDYPNNTITPAGHLEAQALGRRMAKMGLDRIYCSPLGRAVHTMQYSAEALKLPHAVEEWTAELADCAIEFETWGRLAMWNTPGELIRGRSPYPTHENWHSLEWFSRPFFRERFEQLKRDSDAFLARHGYEREGGRYRIVQSNREKIAVFCHNGFGLCWLAHLLEIPLPLLWSGFWLAPSSVTTILMDERSEQWAVPRCLGLGDVSHLYEAGLPVQPRGIIANQD
jgi:probable phosphoglycerate mutase